MAKIVIRPGNSNTPVPSQAKNKIVLGVRAKTPPPNQAWVRQLYTKVMSKRVVLLIGIGIILSCFLLILAFAKKHQPNPIPKHLKKPTPTHEQSISDFLGFDPKNFDQNENNLDHNLFIKEWLQSQKVPQEFHAELTQQTNSLGIDTLKKDRLLKTYKDKSSGQMVYAIYEKENFKFALLQFAPYPSVKEVDLPIQNREVTASGKLRDSMDLGLLLLQQTNYNIASQAEEALKYSVDFFHLENDAEYKLIYDKKLIMGKVVVADQLKAISIKNQGKMHYAFYFLTSKGARYLNEKGTTVEKKFLLAPVKSVRISSKYDLFRRHPVLNIIKAHKGTDFAAPIGTEIFSVADGVVEKATSNKDSGNFIKIRHEKTPYETGYLHMSRFATYIRPGVEVKMGQVIGYVGATGENITGSHVCFRFWKNKEQVDPLKEHFGTPIILDMREEDQFRATCEQLKQRLDKLEINSVTRSLGF